MKLIACHLPSDRVWKKITHYVTIFGGKMRQLCRKQLNYADKFQQLTKLIIKPFECTEQQRNKKHLEV